MKRLRSHLRLLALENRLAPAVLLHSLFPDPTGPQAEGLFGYSVAVGSSYRVVGSGSVSTSNNDIGQAYVYNSANTLIAVLDNPSSESNEFFGNSVAVSGNIVVVGAYRASTGMVYEAGSAYVYDLTSKTPTVPIATLNNPSPEYQDWFGYSVSVSGNYVVVGSP